MPARMVAILLLVTALVAGGTSAVVSWAVTSAVSAAGAAGSDGSDGSDGESGVAGEAGADGTAGPQGERGPAGATGARGETGSAGPRGPAGETGSAGATGATGAGATGAAGPAGPPGIQGIQGVQGDPGDDAGIQTFSAESASGSISVVGPTYISQLGLVPTGPALVGFSVSITSAFNGDVFDCGLEDLAGDPVGGTITLTTTANTPVTFADTRVVTLSTDTVVQLVCQPQGFSLQSSYTDASAYALSFSTT